MRFDLPRAILRLALTIAILGVLGCGASFRPYPVRATLWRDDDMRPFETPPAVVYNPWAWDTIDNTVFRQASEALTYERDREAVNVNALDEVPDSSWFTNRIGRAPMDEDDLRRGACREVDTPPPPWTVTRSKPDGSGPGLVVRAADGRTFLFKVDLAQPERATAADAIASRIFFAAGYFVPCNQVIHFTPSDFVLSPDARTSGASPRPLTREDVDAILERARPAPNGRRRGSLSEYIEGTPLGGWRFDGVRDDDPNDVVPHQHRREVRGMYVLSAWLNHVDARAENNMDSWIEVAPDRGYLRHYVLDTGDSFGITWPVEAAMSRRLGHSHYLDLEQVGVDFLTLGLLDRPYDPSDERPESPTFGFYSAHGFVPDQWRNGYPNPGFERRTERDMAWMARIIAHIGERELRLLVHEGHWSSPALGDQLFAILRDRRRAILERWLTRLSPLAWPTARRVGRDVVTCLEDLAVTSGIRDPATRTYDAVVYRRDALRLPQPVDVVILGGRACAVVPLRDDEVAEISSSGEGVYLVVDMVAASALEEAREERTAPARVHLHVSGAAQVVGLERPDGEAAP